MKAKARQKLEKENPEFVSEVSALSGEELNSRLAQLAKDIETVQDRKEADEDLASAQEGVRQMLAPYTDAKKALRAKSQYIIALLKDRGES